MKKYKIQVKIIFDGEVYVEADTKEEAKSIVSSYFNGTLGSCSDSACDQIIDWDMDISGTTKVC